MNTEQKNCINAMVRALKSGEDPTAAIARLHAEYGDILPPDHLEGMVDMWNAAAEIMTAKAAAT